MEGRFTYTKGHLAVLPAGHGDEFEDFMGFLTDWGIGGFW